MPADARTQIADASVQPYDRFTNLVRLKVEAGAVHKIVWENADTEPPHAFIRFNDSYYALEPGGDTTPEDPEPVLLRWIVERGFREQLKVKGFSFRGSKEYTAYLPKHTYTETTHVSLRCTPALIFAWSIIRLRTSATRSYCWRSTIMLFSSSPAASLI
jgi:hypothetical protein